MSLKRNVTANYLGQGWAAAIGLAFVPIYVQYLGMEAFGLVGLLAIVQAWLTLLDMGMTPTLSREMARHTAGAHTPQSIGNLMRSVEIVCAFIAGVVGLSLWAVSPWLARHWFQASRLPPLTIEHAISIMAAVVALRFIESVYRSALVGLQKQVWYNIANASVTTIRAVGAIAVLAFVSHTVTAFFLWQAVMSVVALVVQGYGVHRELPVPPGPRRFAISSLVEIWRFAAGMIGISALALMLTQMDKVLLSRLLSLEEFGVYTVAATVSGALFMLVNPLTTAMYPNLVKMASQEQAPLLADAYHQGSQLLAVSLAPVALTLAFFGWGSIFAWSGDAALATRIEPIVSLLVLGTLFSGLMQMPYNLQLAFGWTNLAIKTNILALAALIPSLLWLVPRYGAVAAAWFWLILNLGYLIGTPQAMHARLLKQEKWRWYLFDVLYPVGASLGAMLLASLFRPPPGSDRWHWLAFLAVAAAVAYVSSTAASSKLRGRLLQALWSCAESRAAN